MSKTSRWISFVIAFAVIAGCTSNRATRGDDGSSNDAGSGAGARAPFTNGVSTLAGWADSGYLDGSRDVNLFADPVNVAVGDNGTVYVADFDNSKIRAVEPDGTTTTVIAIAELSRPFGMVFAQDGTLYVSTDNDPDGNHSLTSGTVWAIDVGARTATPIAIGIGRPRSLAILSDGRLAAADDLHQVIETIDLRTSVVTTVAGIWDRAGYIDEDNGTPQFSSPYGLVQRSDGKLVVCDYDNNQLRLVGLDGTVTTLAGSVGGFADGPLATAKFDEPQGLAMAVDGDLFVTDFANHRVRRVTATTVETIAGDGTAGYRDSDDPSSAELYGLEGISVSPDGSMIYVADGSRGDPVPFNRVREIELVP